MKNPFRLLLSFIYSFFLVTIGMIFALLFAQKTGKKFRTELSKSDNLCKTLFEELKAVDIEALSTTKEAIDNSEDLQSVIQKGKDQFDIFVDKVKNLSENAREEARLRLESLAQHAQEAALKLRKEGKKIQHEIKHDIKTIAEKLKRG